MKRRLFIGIGIPADIGKRIDRKLDAIRDLPVIWTPLENRHITVLFLGWVDDEQLPDVAEKISLACEHLPVFDININKIVIAPEYNPDRIEAVGEGNDDLRDLYNAIANSLDEFSVDRREFHPHITLGRVRRSMWRVLPEKPTIDISAHFSLPAVELSIFESTMIDGKRKYVPIESIALD
jgi:RNA 2',3'-cyclic 3'-phosphodiesterase